MDTIELGIGNGRLNPGLMYSSCGQLTGITWCRVNYTYACECHTAICDAKHTQVLYVFILYTEKNYLKSKLFQTKNLALTSGKGYIYKSTFKKLLPNINCCILLGDIVLK